ncbi:PadR family transcriptional regulator [Actinotalea sp. AC32]|nr:PadR family transcriptional regulator [Actinotalea sp. AC32]
MADPRDPQLLKGVLPMLVLRLLAAQESYGWKLVTRLRDAGLADISAGTVYPVLNRLEREGQVASRLVASTSGPARKYYTPTDVGRAALARAESAWTDLVHVVAGVLDHHDGTAVPSHTPEGDR